MKQRDRRGEGDGDTMHGIALAYQYGDSRLLKLSSWRPVYSVDIYCKIVCKLVVRIGTGSLPLDCKLYKGHR